MSEQDTAINMGRSMTKMNQEQRRHKRYITGFDGIRTLAVIGVIIYHLMPSAMQGGYLGVPIFFVVSGYLITDLLLQEWERRGSVAVLSFYYRRLKRLYPALVTMLLGTTAYITLFQRSLLTNIRATVLTNLAYVYNWFEIGHGQSYFDRFNGESPFTHLWSLSIEGQYYLFWPLIVIILMLIFKNNRGKIFGLMMIAAVASAITMAILYNPANTNRVYYGTDTRMFAILLGSGLAFAWPSNRLSKSVAASNWIVLDLLGGGSLIALIYLFFNMSGQSDFTYRGGMFIFTVLSAILVATVAHPASHMNAVLSNPLFNYIGKRSYGIYLYQFPVMIFYENRINVGNNPLLNSLIEVGIILVISELSYRFIENPMRRYDYGQLGKDIGKFFQNPVLTRVTGTLAVIATLLFATTAVGFVQQPSQASATNSAFQKTISQRKAAADKKNAAALKKQKAATAKKIAVKKQAASKASQEKADRAALKSLSSHQRKIVQRYALAPSAVKTLKNVPLTAIGDSVLLDVSSDLQDVLPATTIQGKVGRQVTDVPGIIAAMQQSGQLSQNVLINIGTNGTITKAQADQVVHAIGPSHQIFWVTAHVPTRSWQNQVNQQIKQTSRKYANVHMVDWHSAAQNHPNWFVSDNVHPNTTGNRHFAQMVGQKIAEYYH